MTGDWILAKGAQADAYTLSMVRNTLSAGWLNARSTGEPLEVDFASFWAVFRLYLL
jgi:hypothetical protein